MPSHTWGGAVENLAARLERQALDGHSSEPRAGAQDECAAAGLQHLPPDALAAVLSHLALHDIAACMLLSKAMRDAVMDERLWTALCLSKWGAFTDVRSWVVVAAGPAGGSPAAASPPTAYLTPPRTFRALHQLLLATAPLTAGGGLWRLVGEGPAGGLLSFRWTREGVVGRQVQLDALDAPLEHLAFKRICPRRGLSVAAEVLDSRHAVLRDYSRGGAPGARLRRSPSAEAAASVAICGTPGAVVLGSSPQGSFEFEWLQFMAANVARSGGSARKRGGRSPGGALGGAAGPEVLHLRRVAWPEPSPRHPLAGLWAADFSGLGAAGVPQVLKVCYDFSGSHARIRATKVTGDRAVAAGQLSWVAAAAAVPEPWPAADAALVEAVQAGWLEEEEAAGEAAWLMAEDDDEEEEGGGEGEGAAGSPLAAEAAARRRGRTVVSIHAATVTLLAGGGVEAAEEEEVRLWVFSPDRMGLVFEEAGAPPWCLPMRRIDADLRHPAPP